MKVNRKAIPILFRCENDLVDQGSQERCRFRAMLVAVYHWSELVTVKEDIQLIRDALTGHVAKEEVVYEIFKRVMNTGVAITGALIALLLSIIGYLLVNPVSLG